MAASSQQLLPLLRSTRRTSARVSSRSDRSPLATANRVAASSRHPAGPLTGPLTEARTVTRSPAVRWGAAVVEPGSSSRCLSSSHCWEELSSRSRRGRRTTVWVDQVAHGRSSRQPAAVRTALLTGARFTEDGQVGSAVRGDSFAHRRTMHALELAAACVMIVAFLAMAMFV